MAKEKTVDEDARPTDLQRDRRADRRIPEDTTIRGNVVKFPRLKSVLLTPIAVLDVPQPMTTPEFCVRVVVLAKMSRIETRKLNLEMFFLRDRPFELRRRKRGWVVALRVVGLSEEFMTGIVTV